MQSFVIKTVRRVKLSDGRISYLVNGSIWLSKRDLQTLFTDLGLGRNTPYTMAIGNKLNWEETTAPDDTTVENPHVFSGITFKKPGLKRLNYSLQLNKMYQQKVADSLVLEFDQDFDEDDF